MSLTQRTLPTLFNGVSRQPAILRSADQTEDELNSWAALSAGVGKRPPVEHVAKLADSVPGGSYIHPINRDSTEQYFVVISAGAIRVFDFEGDEKTVSAPGGWGYLTGSDFAAVTVADYTFIVNRSVAVTLKDAGADAEVPPTYLRYPSKRPRVLLDEGVVDEYFLSGSEYQEPPNPVVSGLTGTVDSMEDLPTTATEGQVFKVSGAVDTGFTSYYVIRTGGVWEETVAPGLANALDETTMPHCLIREADGTFTFAPFSWAPRRVGDTRTNPNPTFVGRTIRDVAFYQNRLVFLVDESIVMSAAGDFGNFFRSTALDVINSDVVDVAATTANVALLDYIVLFNDGAIIFADQTQFGMSNAEDGVTPASIAIRPLTRYPLNRKARPVVVGTEVYFVGDNAGYSVVYEYTRLADNDATQAAEITAHVPGLIPSGVTSLVAIPRGILALTGTDKMFCYQLYWNGNEKIMSAWRPWQLTGVPLAAVSTDSRIFMVVQEADGVFLERIELAEGVAPANQPAQVFLDRRATVVGSVGVEETSYTLPYEVPPSARETFRLIAGSALPLPYSPLEDLTWVSNTVVKVPGELAGSVTAGHAYPFHVELSQQFQLTPQGVPVTTGRLQLRTVTFNYTKTSSFEVVIYPYGRPKHPSLASSTPMKIVPFTGQYIGSGQFMVGTPTVVDGSFTVTVMGEARASVIRVQSSDYRGATFTSAEWEGFYNKRS